jgi:hypothetical protein
MSQLEWQELQAVISKMTPQEKERLQALLSGSGQDGPVELSATDAESAFRDGLVADGLLQESSLPARDADAFARWRPVEISGKPFSETIVEERR